MGGACYLGVLGNSASTVRRARGALAARGIRGEPVRGSSMAAFMPPTVPQAARTSHQIVGW
ncbi:hypothetical protein DGM85_01520 [Xanthomonas phaseoli pv. phaseoli]|nr:hypothetical protein DGM93_01370 [Xanthomonas phaseoli pv. phaseoli]QWN27416.1 hypothetical protein DGM85_01520 [Xanthomonas phaseoli pv. phaseoli]QWN31564.1 hypothetical protein DGM81_01375 [Xanthomonas phaseoli pv. phaseoli]